MLMTRDGSDDDKIRPQGLTIPVVIPQGADLTADDDDFNRIADEDIDNRNGWDDDVDDDNCPVCREEIFGPGCHQPCCCLLHTGHATKTLQMFCRGNISPPCSCLASCLVDVFHIGFQDVYLPNIAYCVHSIGLWFIHHQY
jgi:hypothetical protein